MQMITFHILRPYWLLGFLPLCITTLYWLRRSHRLKTLEQICDPHLLPHLLQGTVTQKKRWWLLPVLSLSFMLLALSGPAFVKLPVPIFKSQRAHMIVADFSNTMLAEDISPNRLQRAKFKLHDLFQKEKHSGQFGLIVYSGEPFVAAPLTDDTHTIDTLLETLTPDTLPIGGNRLELGLLEAEKSIEQAGFSEGCILVITAETPSPLAIQTAGQLAKKHLSVSILPMLPSDKINKAFRDFAASGRGQVYPFRETSSDILSWEHDTSSSDSYEAINDDFFPRWRDDGRWFLIPALLCLLPLFRKNYFMGRQT